MCHRAIVVSCSDLCLCHFSSVNLAGNKCLGLLCFYLLIVYNNRAKLYPLAELFCEFFRLCFLIFHTTLQPIMGFLKFMYARVRIFTF